MGRGLRGIEVEFILGKGLYGKNYLYVCFRKGRNISFCSIETGYGVILIRSSCYHGSHTSWPSSKSRLARGRNTPNDLFGEPH